MQELELLNSKLDLLLKKYAALQAENNSLKEAMAKQRRSIEVLNTKLEDLEENMLAQKIGTIVSDPKEKEALRKQLDTVISEIDKILVTLND